MTITRITSLEQEARNQKTEAQTSLLCKEWYDALYQLWRILQIMRLI